MCNMRRICSLEEESALNVWERLGNIDETRVVGQRVYRAFSAVKIGECHISIHINLAVEAIEIVDTHNKFHVFGVGAGKNELVSAAHARYRSPCTYEQIAVYYSIQIIVRDLSWHDFIAGNKPNNTSQNNKNCDM